MKRKKLTATLLAFAIFMGTWLGAPAASAAAITPGDVNQDGTIDILDAAVTLRLLAGQSYAGVKQEKNMFVSGDGAADMSDAVLLLRKAAGWEVELEAAPDDAVVATHDKTGIYHFENYRVKFMIQNILHGGGGSRPLDAKKYRMQRMPLLMEKYQPDVIGLQEYRWTDWRTLFEQTIFPAGEYENHIVCRVDLSLNEREGAGSSAEMPLYIEEYAAVFWNDERFDLCTDADGNPVKGNFWFSETPDVMSHYFGAPEVTANEEGLYYDGNQRQAVWVKLHDNHTGEEFYFINCHGPNLDDAEATLYGKAVADLLNNKQAELTAKYGDAPIVMGGDMNLDYCNPSDAPFFNELATTFTDVGELMGQLQGTFPRWGRNVQEDGTIPVRGDIFFTDDIQHATCVRYNVMEETYDENLNELENFGGYNPNYTIADEKWNGYWVSDHLGVFAEFVIT